jgi:hypothetical protein
LAEVIEFVFVALVFVNKLVDCEGIVLVDVMVDFAVVVVVDGFSNV